MIAVLGFDVIAPGLAWVALAGPLVLLAGWAGLAARSRERRLLVSERNEPLFVPRFSPGRARLRVLLAALGALLAGVAAVGPVRGYTLREVRRKGLDLVICVDTSRSMLVQDLKPDRLTRAKREIAGLLDRLQGDRAALLAFSGDVREVAPLTHDRATLAAFANTLTPDDNLLGGTDLGGAIDKSLSLFDGRTGAHEAIVLITDGEDLEGRGLDAAKRASERGIRVYVVGMATAGGGKIPEGGRGFVRDEAGKEVVSALGGATLSAIAQASGGEYLSAESSPFPLEEMYDKRVTRLEGRELVAGKEKIPHDRYQWPLALAAACFFAEAALRERRPRERVARTGAAPARTGAAPVRPSLGAGPQRGAA